MKICFLGNFAINFTSETHWAKSIESLGHEVVRLQEQVADTKTVYDTARECDVFIWVHTHGWDTPKSEGFGDMGAVLRMLKEVSIPTVAYHLDLYMGLGRWTEYKNNPYLKDLQYFFTVDKFMADWLNENTDTVGIYLPAGVFGEECVMLPYQPVRYDIVFTGSRNYHKEYPFRPQLIDFLRRTYGNRFIHIGNDGDVGQRRGLELNQIYRNAKIVVGDTLQMNFDYPYYFSDRAFEVPGRGGFSIFPNIKGIEYWYEDGKEVVLYKHGDLDDLKNKIDYYLTHPLERETIRKAGFERTKLDHTYMKRWESILNEIISLPYLMKR